MEQPIRSEAVARSSSLTPPASMLVLAPSLHTDADAVCTDLLTIDDSDRLRVLIVDVTASPRRVGRRWADHHDGEPAAFSAIGVKYMASTDEQRSAGKRRSDAEHEGAAASAPPASSTPSDSLPAIETQLVQDPGDLSGLGVAASATLDAWADADEQVVVCLRSLTTILQYADDGPALTFLRELLNHCEAAGALAHVHLDPTAIDERTVEAVRGQVDDVLEIGPE